MNIVFGIRWNVRRITMAGLLVLAGFGFVTQQAAAQSVPMSQVRAAIGADAATQSAGDGVDVAVIDSGTVPVPGLDGPGKVVAGPDFTVEAADPDLRGRDTFGHGTHIAGIIAGNDQAGDFRGVAPGARIVSVKAAGADGSTSLWRLVRAVNWVVDHRTDDGMDIRVLNLSWGIQPNGDYRNDLLAWSLERAWRAGITVVTSAGNDGETGPGLNSPAYDPFLIAVGASDLNGTADVADDTVPSWSSRGDGVRDPDLVAPGRGIASLRNPGSFIDLLRPEAREDDGTFRGSGTSQAAGVVSGAAAILIAGRPDLSPDQVKALLRSTAQPLADVGPDAQGAGRLDLASAWNAPDPDPQAAAQNAEPANLRSALRAFLARNRLNAVVSPDAGSSATGDGWGGSRWGGSRWGGSRWGGSRWGGSRWGLTDDGPAATAGAPSHEQTDGASSSDDDAAASED